MEVRLGDCTKALQAQAVPRRRTIRPFSALMWFWHGRQVKTPTRHEQVPQADLKYPRTMQSSVTIQRCFHSERLWRAGCPNLSTSEYSGAGRILPP